MAISTCAPVIYNDYSKWILDKDKLNKIVYYIQYEEKIVIRKLGNTKADSVNFPREKLTDTYENMLHKEFLLTSI